MPSWSVTSNARRVSHWHGLTIMAIAMATATSSMSGAIQKQV